MTSRAGEHYTDEEVALIYRTRHTAESNEALAVALERTPDAIDWVQRHIDQDEGIGPRYTKYLSSQCKLVRRRLGNAARGQLLLVVLGGPAPKKRKRDPLAEATRDLFEEGS